MSTLHIILAAAAVLLIAIVVWAVYTSNSLVYKRNRIRQCRSSISIVIKQRNDLIPNLVSAVKAYMGHENELLSRIAALRARARRASESENIERGAELSALLSRLNIAVESYPELKADTQFLSLQHQISDMDRELQAVRRTCNAAITDYNNAVEMFPSSVVAACGHHLPEQLIEIPESETGDLRITAWLER